MDIFIKVFLPLALIIIMFSLGLGLTLDDFSRVIRRPKAFAIGALSQMIMMPIIGFIIVILFKLPAELAVGVMILAFSPGGVTSNFLSRLARGDLALSISLTAVFSIVAVFTVPPAVKLSSEYFLGVNAPPVNVAGLGLTLFLITATPVVLGMLLRAYATAFTIRIEPIVEKIALIFFIVIVVGALSANWQAFVDNLAVLGPALVALNIVLLFIGLGLGKLFSLSEPESTAIAIETGIQNATVGITVGSLIVEQTAGLPVFSLPSGVYGIIMYVVSIPFVLWRRSRALALAAPAG